MTREIGKEKQNSTKLATGKALLGDIKLVITLSLLGKMRQEPALAEMFHQLQDLHHNIPYPVLYYSMWSSPSMVRWKCHERGIRGTLCSSSPYIGDASKTST